MKNNLKGKVIYILLLLTGITVMSCYKPSPLTGTWADNRGNQMSLYPDYSFTAKIKTSDGKRKLIEGVYNVMLNAITFTTSDGYQVVSEWDIRGSMLYLVWPDSKDGNPPLQLILYKTKN